MSQHPFQNFMIRFHAGEPIFGEGDQGSTMFVVHSGRVGLFRHAGEDRKFMGEMEKGDFFGEMSILEGLARPHSAEALEDCELIEINSTIFDKMIRSNIEIAVRMLRKLSIRLREAEDSLTTLEGPRTGSAHRLEDSPTTSQSKKSNQPQPNGVRLEADGQIFPVNDLETVIGRFDPVTETRPDIDLTELDLKRSVSRQHARIVRTDEGFELIEQVGALNGTFVNDKQLVAGEPNSIVEGDCLRIGSVVMTFRI